MYRKDGKLSLNYYIQTVLTPEALVILYQIGRQTKSREHAEKVMQKNWENVEFWAKDQRDNLAVIEFFPDHEYLSSPDRTT